MAEDEEEQLQAQLTAVSKQFAHLLHELAMLRLEQGRTGDAQKLLSHLTAVRQTPWLDIQSNDQPSGVVSAIDTGHTPGTECTPSPTADSSTNTTATSTAAQAPAPVAVAAISSTALQPALKPTTSVTSRSGQPAAATGTSAPEQPQQPSIQHEDSVDWESKDWEAASIELPDTAGPPLPSSATLQAASQPHISFDWGPPSSSAGSEPAHASTASAAATAKQRRSGSHGQLPALQAPRAEDGLVGSVTWEGGFDHCVEVYNLTVDVKTGHLQTFLDDVLPNVKLQPLIRWADDNHAVLVCPDTTTAQLLLESGEEYGYSLRPFSHATQQSKMLPVSELLPPKARPRTTAAVAKRLLSHALGMPGLRDRHGEQQLADARRAAREERAARRQAASSTWGDDAE